MPDSLVGLILFAALAAPGLVFSARRRAFKPGPTPSAFAETATIVMVSFTAVSVVLLLFLVVEKLFGTITPDVDALVHNAAKEFKDHPRLWLVWGLVLLAVATLGSWVAARIRYRGGDAKTLKRKSLWETAFRDLDESEDGYVFLEIVLTDGSHIDGFLYEYDARYEADEERDIILAAPVIQTTGGEQVELDAEYVVLNARQIRFVGIEYGVAHPLE